MRPQVQVPIQPKNIYTHGVVVKKLQFGGVCSRWGVVVNFVWVFVLLLFFETGSRPASNSLFSYICLLNVGITGVYHHTWLGKCVFSYVYQSVWGMSRICFIIFQQRKEGKENKASTILMGIKFVWCILVLINLFVVSTLMYVFKFQSIVQNHFRVHMN
jgi:hypothetical protein